MSLLDFDVGKYFSTITDCFKKKSCNALQKIILHTIIAIGNLCNHLKHHKNF